MHFVAMPILLFSVHTAYTEWCLQHNTTLYK